MGLEARLGGLPIALVASAMYFGVPAHAHAQDVETVELRDTPILVFDGLESHVTSSYGTHNLFSDDPGLLFDGTVYVGTNNPQFAFFDYFSILSALINDGELSKDWQLYLVDQYAGDSEVKKGLFANHGFSILLGGVNLEGAGDLKFGLFGVSNSQVLLNLPFSGDDLKSIITLSDQEWSTTEADESHNAKDLQVLNELSARNEGEDSLSAEIGLSSVIDTGFTFGYSKALYPSTSGLDLGLLVGVDFDTFFRLLYNTNFNAEVNGVDLIVAKDETVIKGIGTTGSFYSILKVEDRLRLGFKLNNFFPGFSTLNGYHSVKTDEESYNTEASLVSDPLSLDVGVRYNFSGRASLEGSLRNLVRYSWGTGNTDTITLGLDLSLVYDVLPDPGVFSPYLSVSLDGYNQSALIGTTFGPPKVIDCSLAGGVTHFTGDGTSPQIYVSCSFGNDRE